MPPALLFDLSTIDLDRIVHDREAVRKINPQRGDMEHLDGIIYIDQQHALGFKDVREDEFWVPGHIPGRPLLPGVVMLESAAQVASFFTATQVGWDGFIGFGGVEDCRFRNSVSPGCRMYILVSLQEHRHRRIRAKTQGLVNGNLVFEATIIGTRM